jgi:Tfp pilus assembly protein PilF
VKNYKNAASDLDEAVGIEPQNVQAWTSRGLAYERLGDKQKAAGSYARAMNIDQTYQPARDGFERVGGRFGQSYQAF